jgi:hypothetical protein
MITIRDLVYLEGKYGYSKPIGAILSDVREGRYNVCPTCQGSGQEFSCADCDGTGYVTRETLERMKCEKCN